jgi:hypothetical protein
MMFTRDARCDTVSAAAPDYYVSVLLWDIRRGGTE